MNETNELTSYVERSGYYIGYSSKLVPFIKAAAARIYTDFAEYGLSAREYSWWKKEACWFPHLRDSEEIKNLCLCLPEEIRSGVACEPQILLDFPVKNQGEYIMIPHIDQEPPWANGRKYLRIVGVPLTPFNKENGGVTFWSLRSNAILPFNEEERFTPSMGIGSYFIMHPNLPHSGGRNYSSEIRAAVYFRYLRP